MDIDNNPQCLYGNFHFLIQFLMYWVLKTHGEKERPELEASGLTAPYWVLLSSQTPSHGG